MDRFLCIHGHFYQPPRENPWLEAVEVQDTAHPYHDWNERITAECYATNGASRILDESGRIRDIVSNYARMSFNMGPTLLNWLEKHAAYTYNLVREADRLSRELRSGHGAALAQCYNHVIMPLASARDKRTQVVWGIGDFLHRFHREPEGMWLPETAVDLETFDIMAEKGIRFSILAPHQAARVRRKGERTWDDVSGGRIDPTRSYLCRLPSGRSITLMFYDAPISHAVAFEGILDSGERFAKRLLNGFSDDASRPQLVHIATDGESYGHHHRFGDMALAYAMHYIETNNLARLTNYGEFLDHHPPEHEVEIFAQTSWSCAHGVERWRSNCGCSTGGHPGWDQEWRAPLRQALDWLREELSSTYEDGGTAYFTDPWGARDDYIAVLTDRSAGNVEDFFARHATRSLTDEEQVAALKLLEIQRHAMLMYTSCGWFFDDISGIETVQVLQYAGRAIQLAREVRRRSLEGPFLTMLEDARSNVPEQGSGASIYERSVRPAVVDLPKVAAHFAISSLYEDYSDQERIFCYAVDKEDYQKSQAGSTTMVTGRCRITSEITKDTEILNFGVLHLGGHDFNCGVRRAARDQSYERLGREMNEAFERGAFADLVRLVDRHFGSQRYSLKNLFRDEQRHILETIIAETMTGFEVSYRRMYDENRLLMGFLKEAGIPVVRGFLTAAQYTLNLDLKRQLEESLDVGYVQEILEELRKWDLPSDSVDLEFTFRHRLIRDMIRLQEDPENIDLVSELEQAIDISEALPFKLNLWPLQNTYYSLAGTVFPAVQDGAADDVHARQWVERFRSLGEKLHFNLETLLEA